LLGTQSTHSWRLFLATEVAVALVFFLLRLSAPESPHWLLSRGKFADAAEAFMRIVPGQREAVLRLTTDHEKLAVLASSAHGSLSTLFSRRYRSRTALVAIPWFLMDIATYGVGLFTPTILGAINTSATTGGLAAQDFGLAEGSALIDLFLLAGFLLGILTIPRFGRIRMQVIGFAGMAVGMFILAAAVGLTSSPFHVPLVFAGFILFNLLMNAGPNSTTFTFAPILFPTQLRGTASGFAAGIAKLGATLGVFLLPIFKQKFGIQAVLGIVSGVSLLGLIITFALRRNDTNSPVVGIVET
jgi:MFS transporter, putative metabolite transport protein